MEYFWKELQNTMVSSLSNSTNFHNKRLYVMFVVVEQINPLNETFRRFKKIYLKFKAINT